MRRHRGVWSKWDTRNVTTTEEYSLHPKIQVILGFKIWPKKQVILPCLESACACKNQLVPNMVNKQG